ncbi:hypothetical protein G7Y29_08250 [Corynebacterium qintianiae]|uniref:Uncharacterized protein n=1 Tax=Corynebacterium qintianiae TaxID=2709392 RepID=A0A7T0KLA1_9CORY|nr:hypothetical protein [Corynebacterium qintianiae]QPK82851.1 hypothetical protein G7Y29_08250 [Corynebacterium qintianiae]
MRTLWFALAAFFSLVALAGNWLSLAGWVSVLAIVLAGLFLLLGFYEQFKNRVEEPIALDGEQEATIRRMKAEGNTPLAVRQVQMWFRYASAEDAARVVRGL